MGEGGGRVFRNMYKRHVEKTKGGKIEGSRWGELEWRECLG